METCTAYYNYTFRLTDNTSVVGKYVITSNKIRIGLLICLWSMLQSQHHKAVTRDNILEKQAKRMIVAIERTKGQPLLLLMIDLNDVTLAVQNITVFRVMISQQQC